ncbi:hypothetical protein H2201_002551 [Coniosporium apollinis]|uniref:Uncharacterized protein n=1 Tax=Coniosporium apollinis TaxID=61459 RepID=A0ABQ9NY94_9PEZI|nr:hypothetical protein H2201_002551 [Coniosporium apollinis]
MAPRTRRRANNPETVYRTSPRLQQKQQRFPSRRRSVKATSSVAGEKRTPVRRQETLTQVGFVSSFSGGSGGEDEDGREEEWAEERPRKKRKRSSDGDMSGRGSGKKQTTLTQMVWPAVVAGSDDEEVEGEVLEDEVPASGQGVHGRQGETTQLADALYGAAKAAGEDTQDGVVQEPHESLQENVPDHEIREEDPHEKDVVPAVRRSPRLMKRLPGTSQRAIGSPAELSRLRTPRKIRVLEVPSSQSPPATPLSTQRTQTPHSRRTRSPLKERSVNRQAVLETPSKLRTVLFADDIGSAKKAPFKMPPLPAKLFNPKPTPGPARLIRKTTIPDSQAIDDEETEDDGEHDDEIQEHQAPTEAEQRRSENTQATHPEQDSIRYLIGPETQALGDRTVLSDIYLGSSIVQDNIVDEDEDIAGLPDSTVRSFEFDLDVPTQKATLKPAAPQPPDSPFAPRTTRPNFVKNSTGTDEDLLAADSQPPASQTRTSRPHFTQQSSDFLRALQADEPADYSSWVPRAARATAQPFHPSQATTVDITQAARRTQHTLIPSSPQRASSPVVEVTRIPDSPLSKPAEEEVVYIPSSPLDRPMEEEEAAASSSPLPLPPSDFSSQVFEREREPQGKQGGGGGGLVTVSQLLPDSLMNFTLPRPPVWSQDEEGE